MKSKTNLKKCVYFDRGYCKHGEKCSEFHPKKDEICLESSCFSEDCNLRHPNPCKFGKRCTFLKKNECLFSHLTPVCDDNKKAILELEKKFKYFEIQKNTDYEALENGWVWKTNKSFKKFLVRERYFTWKLNWEIRKIGKQFCRDKKSKWQADRAESLWMRKM